MQTYSTGGNLALRRFALGVERLERFAKDFYFVSLLYQAIVLAAVNLGDDTDTTGAVLTRHADIEDLGRRLPQQ